MIVSFKGNMQLWTHLNVAAASTGCCAAIRTGDKRKWTPENCVWTSKNTGSFWATSTWNRCDRG